MSRREITETARLVEEPGNQGNLTAPLTSFIGREREISELSDLLDPRSEQNSRARLVTLTGSGGAGKTRLALEVASHLRGSYPDGIWLIELASISHPGLVVQKITSTLGIPESRDENATSTLKKYLASKGLLLILDNCEQVIEAAGALGEDILQSAPLVRILATSREILGIPGEVPFRVPSLSTTSDAVRLFVERARVALPSFAAGNQNASTIEQICGLVDGLPLGIELAAANVSVLSVGQIAARLQDNLHLAGSRTALPQHRTLEATIQWSYDLLSDIERAVLQRLSLFSGGWTLEAAESVSADGVSVAEEVVLDVLAQLANKSLVLVDTQASSEARYGLLRLVRQFCLERLTMHPTELKAGQERHFRYFRYLVGRANDGLMTAHSPDWLRKLDLEQDNLRAALAYGQALGKWEETLDLAGSLFWYWQTRGHISEGRGLLSGLLEGSVDGTAASSQQGGLARAKALWAAAGLAWIQADYGAARSLIEESISLWRLAPSEEHNLAISLRDAGIIATYQGDLEYAHAVLQESIRLLQSVGNMWNLALAFYNRGLVFESQNDLVSARADFQESLSLFRKTGEPWGLSVALFGLGRIAGRQADYAAARIHLEESLELTRRVGDPWSDATTLYLLGELARLQGHLEDALAQYAESLLLNQVVGDRAMIAFTLHNFGRIASLQGDRERSARLFGAAQSVQEDSTNTTSWSLTDHVQREQDMVALRAEMGAAAFESARGRGHALNSDEAIAYALSGLEW